MQFGVCGNLDVAAIAARASYDYAEWSVPELLKPRESDEVFAAFLEDLRQAALPYPVANCFVPGDLKITGPEADMSALRAFVSKTMGRAEQAGIEVVVFGSGGARRIPDGFDSHKAHDQLVAFSSMVAPLAHDHGVTVVVEPLNTAECNVLTTVAGCAALVNEVDHPGVRLLVDAYHLMRDGDSYDDIVKYGELLAHVHIATEAGRRAPGAEPCDFSRFFESLSDANYTGRVSIECGFSDPETEIPEALPIMRRLSA